MPEAMVHDPSDAGRSGRRTGPEDLRIARNRARAGDRRGRRDLRATFDDGRATARSDEIARETTREGGTG